MGGKQEGVDQTYGGQFRLGFSRYVRYICSGRRVYLFLFVGSSQGRVGPGGDRDRRGTSPGDTLLEGGPVER